MAISSVSSACFLLFMTAIMGCSLAEVLRIVRDSTFHSDDFLLPSSQCPGGQPQCSKFNGSVLAICWCTCNDIQSQTTGFFEPSYGCTQVSRVRHQAGCQILFTDETTNQRLTFFPTDSIREKDVNVPANKTCSFFYGNRFYVQYLDCTGSWRSITQQSVLDAIELTPGWSTNNLRIRIRAGSTQFVNITAGRLVRVAIQCRSQASNDQPTSSCVVFQVHGSIECPFPQPTLSPALAQATLPTPVAEVSTSRPVTTPATRRTTRTFSEKATKSRNTTQVPNGTRTLSPRLNQTTPPTPVTKRKNSTRPLPPITTATEKPTPSTPSEHVPTTKPDCLPALANYLWSLASLLQSVKSDLEKTKQELQEAIGQWPPGHYCILASGSCPAGFTRHAGHMRALRQYTATHTYINQATFGSSSIKCHGRCGQYGQWVGDLVIAACCK
ncbi:uncharacterized protein LOC144640903 isoform X2 [Oculina patagonica]